MEFVVEKPPEEELDRVLEKYRRIRRRVVDWDWRDFDESTDYPPCFGEVVLLILDGEGRLAVVRKRGSPEDRYMLPMGRINEGEGVEEAAEREALEETGLVVRVDDVSALHRARIRFKRWNLERWYFIVQCSIRDDGGSPPDRAEIEEVMFVGIPSEIPVWWVRAQWFLWVLKDAGLIHPHSFLLGKPEW